MSEDFPAYLGDLRPGMVLAGYQLEAPVAAGGMGAVFRARDVRLGRLVALKVLIPALASDPAFRRRFIAESRAAAAVDHPHIIPVYEANEADGVLFIAMRFVAGGDLRRVLDTEGALAARRAAEFISPVASALDAAHAAHLVHRDVKPGNILVDTGAGRPDHVYLSDFGVTKGAATSVSLTQPGYFLGTPDYAAPEQVNGVAVDGRADQYALACVTYQLLTAEVPFARDHGMAVLLAHVSAPPPSLTARRPDLPAAADVVLAKGMAKTPDERFASCGDFADALREALDVAPYNPGTSGPGTPHARPARVPPPATPESKPPAAPDPVPDEQRGTVPVGPVGNVPVGNVLPLTGTNKPFGMVARVAGRTIALPRRALSLLIVACVAAVAAAVVPLVLSSSPQSPNPPGQTGTSSAGAGGSSAGAGSTGAAVAAPKAGGSITVLEVADYSGGWSTLDPAENVDGAASQSYMDAIYGQLFELGPGGKVVPDLATGYTFSPNAETVTVTLRQGVTFTDGTPFNAQAVYTNWERDLGTTAIKTGVSPMWSIPTQPVPSGSPAGTQEPPAAGAIEVTGPYTIVVHQNVPNGAFINELFDSIANWIASPTALQKEGASFGQHPVGAGPFEVVSNVPSKELVVRKNPGYWQAGRPYLDQITFKTVSSDQAAYADLLAGQGQVYEDMSTTALINESQAHFEVEDNLGTSPYDLQLNTADAPFNNPKARQAIYAATDFAPILQQLFGNRYPLTESFTGPGGICYEPTVPGYQGYDPALARQLVQQSGLNKVTITLGSINEQVSTEVTAALKAQWAKVGIKVTTASYSLSGLISAFTADNGKQWQAMLQTAGSFDPAAGTGVGFRFQSTSPFSGVHDRTLDAMLSNGQATVSLATRCTAYGQLAAYIAKEYYGPFYFPYSPANVSVKGVGGPGLSSPLAAVAVTPAIPWEDVYYTRPGS